MNLKRILQVIVICIGIFLAILTFDLVSIFPGIFFPEIIYCLRIIILVFLILFSFKSFISLLIRNPVWILLLLILTMILTIKINSPPEKDKIGFISRNNFKQEYSQKHWYFLNRISPLFPFDHTGLAYISKKDGLTIPDGYRTTREITADSWYSIITNRFYYFSILYGVLMGFGITFVICLVLNKYIIFDLGIAKQNKNNVN